MGKTAWFALKNSKTRTAPHRSRGQTRPRLERGCRAPAAAACSHAAAAPAPRALPRSGRCRRPRRVYLPGGPPADRLAPPSCGSPGMTARTHEPEPAPGLDPGVRRITPRAHQLDHLPPELRRIRNMCLGHGQHLSRKLRGVHRTGATSHRSWPASLCRPSSSGGGRANATSVAHRLLHRFARGHTVPAVADLAFQASRCRREAHGVGA